MANDCAYDMRAVSKDRGALERLKTILKYEDSEYYIYRVREMEEMEGGIVEDEENGLFHLRLFGDVAWSDDAWVHDEERKDILLEIGYEKDGNGEDDLSRPVFGTAHKSNLPVICKALGISIEIWAEEYGMGFQHHTFIAKDGTYSFEREDAIYVGFDKDEMDEGFVKYLESEGYTLDDIDEDRYYVGGFKDFGRMMKVKELWEQKDLGGDL